MSINLRGLAVQNAGRFLAWKTQESGSTSVNGVPTDSASGVEVASEQVVKVAVAPTSSTISFRVWLDYGTPVGFAVVDSSSRSGITRAWTQEYNVSGAKRIYVEVTSITGGGTFAVHIGKGKSEAVQLFGESVITNQGKIIDFDTLASDPNTVLLFGSYSEFPSIRDYAGTYTDAELSDVASLENEKGARGLLTRSSRLVSGYPFKAVLHILDDIVIRSMCMIDSSTFGTTWITDFSATGDTEATNYSYSLRVTNTTVSLFTETGAGSNQEAAWEMPGGLLLDEEYLFELRRTTGGINSMYVNGLRLGRFSSTTGGTDNGDGTFTALPSGGSSNVLCDNGFATGNSALNPYFLHIIDTESSAEAALDYAEDKRPWADLELSFLQRSDHATKAGDANAVAVFEPTVSGFEDQTTNAITFDVSDTIATDELIGGTFWTSGGSAESTDSLLQLTGDLTINVLAMYEDTSQVFTIEWSGSGETSADNFLYRFGITDATTFNYFAETGAGTNINVAWTIDALAGNEIREFRLVREADGGGNHNVRLYERKFPETTWTQLTVSISTGTGVGTTEANVAQPTDGSAGTFKARSGGRSIRSAEIYDAALNP